MKNLVTPAKISRPRLSGVLPRNRLFRLLDDKHDQPILWIAGPPGVGKTTLAASWLEARQMRSLWFQLDESDSDPASFFYYLGLAAQRANPRKRRPLPFLTPEYLHGIPTFSRRFFENVYARLIPVSQPCASTFAIVFDNCQEVPGEALFDEILSAGISHVPSGIKIIFISRKDPPEAFVRLRANSLMQTVGWDELKFTLEESNEMVRLRGYKTVSNDVLRQLHEKTDGWAAGTVLILEGAGKGGIESALSKVRASKEIFQYFAREILGSAEPETKDFLLKTSLFQRMSAKMTEALTGNHHAQNILSKLNARNYFTQRLESETAVYQYHPLFREFLQLCAREVLDPEEFVKIVKKAAILVEENGNPEDSFELLKRAEDWPNAVRLILKHALSLTRQGRNQTLEGWIKSLPDSVVEEEPWLLYWKGICIMPFAPADSRGYFEGAFKLFRTRRNGAGVFLSLSGRLDSIAYSYDSFKHFDEALALLDEVSDEFPDFPSLEVEAGLTGSKLWALVFRQPWRPEIKKTAERAHSIFPIIRDVNIKMQVLHSLLFHHIFLGELQTARPLLNSFRELSRTPDISPLIMVTLKFDESLYYLSAADFEQCGKSAEEGLQLASATGVHTVDSFLLAHRTAAAIDSGDMEGTDSCLKKMATYLNHMTPWVRSVYYHLLAWKLLVQGDFSNSILQAKLSLKYALDAGAVRTVPYQHLVCAMALYEIKREGEAMDHLSDCYATARSIGNIIVEIACLFVQAKFAFDKGDDSSGVGWLTKALSLGSTKGCMNMPYVWVPSMMADLCRRALEAGIEVDYVRRMIRKRNLMPDPAPLDCQNWPWALKIYTLGRFEILRDDQALQFSGKVQKRPLELLKVLIANHGAELSEEFIVDCLWPDATAEGAHSAFKTTLSRLRRLLGVERAILFHEGKASLNPRFCWVDATAFERALARFERQIEEETARDQGGYSKSLQLFEKAVEIYRGHFLPADYGLICTISYRERLRSRFSRLITKWGDLLEKAGQWATASEYYQKGIDIEDLSEEFYQRLMICYRKLGRDANAIETYARCRRLLSLKMGIEPSETTKAIYESISGCHKVSR